MHTCVCPWGCADTCVSARAQAAAPAGPRPQPPGQGLLTSWKQSRSPVNSGSAFSTVRTMLSMVCSEAAQRLCENFLNRGWDRKGGGVWPRPAGEGLQDTHTHMHACRRTHMHADMHTAGWAGPGVEVPGPPGNQGRARLTGSVSVPFSKVNQLWLLRSQNHLPVLRVFPPSPPPPLQINTFLRKQGLCFTNAKSLGLWSGLHSPGTGWAPGRAGRGPLLFFFWGPCLRGFLCVSRLQQGRGWPPRL